MSELAPGDPWPGGANGEVFSPSGKRAYLANRAAKLAGRTSRWATDLARRGEVTAETGRTTGQRGAAAWFIHADSFESVGRSAGWWPPDPATPANWDVLFALQGADLDAARRKIRELEQQVEQLLDERNDLLDVVATLTKSARQRPESGTRGRGQ